MNDMPSISVVVPTCNRAASLRRLLESLSRQDYPASLIEVIVVADGCRDDTAAMVASLTFCYRLTLLEQTNLGPSEARNTGARHASGELLIFLDDDCDPSPGLVSAHVALHRSATCKDLVVIGCYSPRVTIQRGLYRASLMHWWETIFSAMEKPAHRFRMVDMLGGNFSLSPALYISAGGFDKMLRCHEDYEFGLRLIKVGAAFAFSRHAWAHHYETSDLDRSMSRKFEEGRADVLLARKYPEIITELPLVQRSVGSRLAFRRYQARVADGVLTALLRAAEALKMRQIWRRLVYLRLSIAYWEGVAIAAGSRAALSKIWALSEQENKRIDPVFAVDLADGIEAAEAKLDQERPTGMFVHIGGVPVGTIPVSSICERLHGGHLRPWLATDRCSAMLQAMAAVEVRRKLAKDKSGSIRLSSAMPV